MSKFVSLANSSVRPSITILNSPLSQLEGKNVVVGDSTFTLTAGEPTGNEIKLEETGDTYAYGYLKVASTTSSGYYVAFSPENPDVSPMGVMFTRNGVAAAFKLRTNVTSGKISVKLGESDTADVVTYTFGEAAGNEVHVNSGYSKVETASFLKDAINATLSNYGIFAKAYFDTVILYMYRSSGFVVKNISSAVVRFSDVASPGDTLKLNRGSGETAVQFGSAGVPIGDTPYDSAVNMAEHINGDTSGEFFASVQRENDYTDLRIYAGFNEDLGVSCESESFSLYSLLKGSSTSEVSLDLSGVGSAALELAVTACDFGDRERTVASFAAAVRSLDDNLTAKVNRTLGTCEMTYEIAGYNLPMSSYGGNISVLGLSGAEFSSVDPTRTAMNMLAKFEEVGYNVTRSGNTIGLELPGKVRVTSDAARTALNVSPYSGGTEDDPMGKYELALYVEDITGSVQSNVELDIVIAESSALGYDSIPISGMDRLTLSIATGRKVITLSNAYLFVISGCSNSFVNISGSFITHSTGSTGGIVSLDECANTRVSVVNCENAWTGSTNSPFVTFNGSMGSALDVRHSTFTSSDASYAVDAFKTDGYVKATFDFCVFDGNSAEKFKAIEKGSGCSASFTSTAYSKSTLNGAVDSTCVEGTDGIVIDRSGAEYWSLSLSGNSPALRIAPADPSVPDDRFGRKRYRVEPYGVTTIEFKDVVGIGKFYGTNFIEINGSRRYFGSDKLPLDYVSVNDFAKSFVSAFSTADVGFKPVADEQGSIKKVRMYGKSGAVVTNLGSNQLQTSFEAFENGIDAGSRQKTTVMDETLYMSLSPNQAKGYGTQEHPFSTAQLEGFVNSLMPASGRVQVIVTGHSQEKLTCSLASPHGPSSFDFVLSGPKTGKAYVPDLECDLSASGLGGINLSVDSVLFKGDLSCGTSEVSRVSVTNSIVKGDITADSVKVSESTIVGGISMGDGGSAICGSVLEGSVTKGQGNDTATFRFNCHDFEVPQDWDTTGSARLSESCLVGQGSYSALTDYDLRRQEGYSNPAESRIPSGSVLEIYLASELDAAGRHRSSESSKVTMDCGALERNVVVPEALMINVDLSAGKTGNGGRYSSCSLGEAYATIKELGVVNRPVVLEVSGYGTDLPTLDVEGLTFTDDGEIKIMGEPGSVMDGFLDGVGFNLGADNAKLSICGVLIRSAGRLAETSGKYSTIVLSSCGVVNTNNLYFMVDGSWDVYMLGCSFEGGKAASSSEKITLAGCAVQGSLDTKFQGDYVSIASIDNAPLAPIPADARLTAGLFVPTSEVAGFTRADIESVMELFIEYEGLVDARGSARFVNDEKSDQGCYDTRAVSDIQGIVDTPNGQYARITEEGSSLITRAMTGKMAFKIAGYALGSGGFSLACPVMSVPADDTLAGLRAVGSVTLMSNNLSVEDYVEIGSTRLYATRDFELDTTVSLTAGNLVESINKNCGSVYAYSESGSNGKIILVAVTPGVAGNNYTVDASQNFEVSGFEGGEDGGYGMTIRFPADGYSTFEFVERLPLAIALFIRVSRYEVSAGLGEVLVYAQVTKSEQPSEVGALVPFAVVRHGLITKDRDTVVTRRVIIQI